MRHLTTFRLLAHTLSFTRAAAVLHYTQSNVSTQIHALEVELGVRLFDRLGRRVALTDAGHRLLVYADRILGLVEEARTATAEGDEVTGTLTLSAPESLCTYRLPAVLREMRERHPGLRVVFRPCPVADLRRLVSEGAVDAAYVLEESLLSSQALIAKPLTREAIRLVAAPEHPLAQCQQVLPAALHGQHLLLTERGCTYRSRLERRLAAAGALPASTLEFASMEAIRQCVMLGMGIALLPEVTVAEELERRQLVALPWQEDEHLLLTHVLFCKERGQARGLQALLAVSSEILGMSEVR